MPEAFITASAVGHSYGDRQILEQIDLTIHSGDRTAIVGPNGSGKTTLLRLLAGRESPTAGRVNRVRGLRVALLPQVTGISSDRTIQEELADRTGVTSALTDLNRETKRLESGDLSRIQAHSDAVDVWTRLGGDDFDARVSQALERTGIDPNWSDRRLDRLSGGQLARINLATLHLSRIDVALLDEPGNHLDREGLETLGRLLETCAPAVVVSSHDRALLSRFADDVVELERGSMVRFRGGWEVYQRERQRTKEKAFTDWKRASDEKRRLVSMERRISVQAEVGERRAKRSSETDKFIRHDAIESSQKNTAASGISKRIEALEVPQKPWKEGLCTLLLDSTDQVHTPQVATVRGAVLRRESWVSRPLDLSVLPGERLLLTGPNGSGKSSLIAALASRIEPISGTVAVPASVRIVELAQQGSVFAEHSGSLVDRFRQLSGLNETDSRTSLAAMKLSSEQVTSDPAELSPGELTRAELALLARRGAACLLLDEPSNHLDIEAIEVLEHALKGWSGSLVVASHDQAFREAVKFDQIVEL